MSSAPLHSTHSGVVSFPTKLPKTSSLPSRPSLPLIWFSIAIMGPSPQHLWTQVSNGTHSHSIFRCYSINKGFRDAPNAWPPHQYIILKALKSLPANVSKGALPTPSSSQSTFDLIPSGQLGLAESALPGQPIHRGSTAINSTSTGPSADLSTANGTVVNGGTAVAGEGWSHALQRELANRYLASALCSW